MFFWLMELWIRKSLTVLDASLSNTQNCGFQCSFSSMLQVGWKVLTMVDASLFGSGQTMIALEL